MLLVDMSEERFKQLLSDAALAIYNYEGGVSRESTVEKIGESLRDLAHSVTALKDAAIPDDE